jgi:nucleolar GTP-binding protein
LLVIFRQLSEENVAKLKTTACDKLLEARVDSKLSAGKIRNDVLARISVAVPKPRDGVQREPCIPASILQRDAAAQDDMDVVGQSGLEGNPMYVCVCEVVFL